MNTTFIFVRHAECEKNLEDITGGLGGQLTNYGLAQIGRLVDEISSLANNMNCKVISSNIMQAKQTASIISNELRIPLVITDELRPADMGIISGLTKREIELNFPEIYHQFSRWRNREIEACELSIAGMEPPDVFWNRILTYLKTICTGGVNIVVCTRSILVLIYNYVHNKSPQCGGGYKHINIENCGMISFESNNEGELLRIIGNLTSKGLE